ncbi:Acyltransferase family [Yersinia frederiksenii]|nr:Acyltransferase family [Yersinia frederiksenii]
MNTDASANNTTRSVVAYWPGIDPVRVVLAVIIVILHTNFHYIPQGYLAVELFFIISGFLIASRKKANSGVLPRFLKTTSSIYPSYLASIILTIAVSPQNLNDIILAISLLQAVGLNDTVINSPTWFLTCYLWVGLFYSFLHTYFSDKNLYAFSTCAAILGYACLFSLTPAHGLNYTTETTIGFLPPSIIRAVAGIGLGITLYAFYQYLPKINLKKSVVSISEILIVSLCVYLSVRRPISVEMDTSFLPLGFILVYFLVAQNGIISTASAFLGKKYNFWRNVSFDLFIFHFPLLLVTYKIVGHPPMGALDVTFTVIWVCFISIVMGFFVRKTKPIIFRFFAQSPSF